MDIVAVMQKRQLSISAFSQSEQHANLFSRIKNCVAINIEYVRSKNPEMQI